MFRSKKKRTEYITPEFYKDWGNASYEIERLGARLDATREAIKRLESWEKPEDHWALTKWRLNEQIILRKWKHAVRLKETGLRQTGTINEGPKIDYNWWEPAEEVVGSSPIWNYLVDKLSGGPNLNRAWDMAKQHQLEMARKGLA